MRKTRLLFSLKKNSLLQSAVILIVFYYLRLPLLAAGGCELNDPERDVKLLFPESTGFRTFYISVAESSGPELLRKIESRLKDKFAGLFETIDVPYTVYEIYKKNELIGYIHGVNQKGRYGGLQVFLALTPDGEIRGFYLQKFTGRGAKQFRVTEFAHQFKSLRLVDFDNYHPAQGVEEPPRKISQIKNPAPEASDDFRLS